MNEMQEIYDYIQVCDNILIAPPIYFSELTGKLLDVGGRDGHTDKAYETACTLLHHMNCYNIHEVVFSHNTNERPAINDEQALMGVRSIIDETRNIRISLIFPFRGEINSPRHLPMFPACRFRPPYR